MGKTISFVKGKGSLSHNNRDFVADNVDKDRMDWNIYYIQQSLKEAYALLFTSAIEDYNSKQKRKSRWVTDYLSDIKNSGNNEKPFYEVVVQIGRKEDTGVLDVDGKLSMDAEVAKMILDEYVRTFQERNPNLYLFNAVLHMDEATPHLHLDYIPVAHGYKTKMHTRNSLTKALQEMGIEPATSKLDTETMHWQKRERDYLMGICRERGLEVEFIGEKRDNYTIPEYKAARQAADELNAELEILNAEKQEAEAAIASINSVAEISREEVAESKQHLAEINAEIAEREKRYAVYEKKIDKVIAAGKPVKKELDSIRSRTKLLPVILGGEASIKISEKDFERIMDMAQASGTLEKLNEAYDRDIDLMQGKIDKLTSQIQILKDKLSKTETFLKMKGLLEEFKESLKPKSVKSELKEKKLIVAEREATRTKDEIQKRKGIAI
ncbi:MAG: plasmid recombination protein [Lachnospiraceae bacterium]|nr:plasmid recombination protein [Lachnospiraceae bacterium]MBQ2450818.1 plasmid recombination protein [Lachnospiraceae bacterium]